MAEKRMISKVISISKKFNICLTDHFSRLLFVLMIPHSDDFGRLIGDPFKIKALILPMMGDVTWEEVEQSLAKLHNAELIVWYESANEKYIQIINFDEHQQGLHKRTRSKIPEAPGSSRKFPEIPSEGKGTEGNRTEEKRREQNGSEENFAPAQIELIKDNLLSLCNKVNIQGFTLHDLDIVYSYIGVADVEVIEACIKKSQNKPRTYLVNTLDGVINRDGLKRKEQLPGAKVGEGHAESGVQHGGTTPASESITGGQVGWLPSKWNRPADSNIVQLPNVSG